MSKLFALENMDEQLTAGEMEVSPEEGEVADVQAEIGEEVGEMDDQATAIDEGVEASGQMEEVEELVANAAEEGEGLDPVSADAVRIAVEAICARVGANPKTFYSLYATENFQSASSRKANTRFALEGVGEFLKDMWKKIKAALQNLWTKVKAFWDKHISSLGRIKKALESMKTKISESSGKLKDKAYIEEAPGALVDAVGHAGDISVKTFEALITAHEALLQKSSDVAAMTQSFNSAAAGNITDLGAAAKALASSVKGGKTGVLVGGTEIDVKYDIDTTEGTVTLEIEREQVDRKDKGGVSLAEKADLKGLVDKMLKVIADNVKFKEKQTKLQESFNKYSLAVEKAINNSGLSDADMKLARTMMKIVYRLNAKAPVFTNEALGLNIRLSKAVLNYSTLCLKNYK